MMRQLFHLVEPSPWPIFLSISIGSFGVTLAMALHSGVLYMVLFCFLMSLIIMTLWWRDIIREASFLGLHTSGVKSALRFGMVLFITSEVMFFFAFFFAFFHSSVSPATEIGCFWPPKGLSVINPLSVPLLNTVVLLSSGFTVTMAHFCILNGNLNSGVFSLALTVILGSYFVGLQWMEYLEASFSISDSVYGSLFFTMTGFHGIHVLVGTMFLLIAMMRLFNQHFSISHHLGLEIAAWYWHFVDVVWIFLFLLVYCWASVNSV